MSTFNDREYEELKSAYEELKADKAVLEAAMNKLLRMMEVRDEETQG